MPLKTIKVLLRVLPLCLLIAGLSLTAEAAVSKTSKRVIRYAPPPIIDVPGFTAAALSTSSIQWNWSTGTFTGLAITGYHLYSSSVSTSTPINLTPSTSYYIDAGLGVNRQYTRWITSYDGTGQGSDSDHLEKYTYAVAPATFNIYAVTANSAYINWSYSSATAYAVEYSTDGGSYYARNRAIFVPWQTLDLLSNRNYLLRIGALNGDNELTPGEYSLIQTTTTPPMDISLTAIAISSYTIEWRWDTTPFIGTDITSFKLYKSSTTEAGTPAADDAGGVIATLTPQTTYWRETYAKGADYTGDNRHARWLKAFGVLESVNRSVYNKYTYAVAPSSCGLLTTPTDYVNIGETYVNLAWPSGRLATKYPVETSTTANFATSMSSFVANALSAPMTGLTSNTKYDFRVGAINGDNEQTPDNALNPEAYSAVYKVVTRPPAPITIVSPITDTIIKLSWSTATYTGMNYITGYVVSTPVYHPELGSFVNHPISPAITDLSVGEYNQDYRLTNSTHTMGIFVRQTCPGYAAYGSLVINDTGATFATPPNDVSFYSVRSSAVGLIWNEPIVPATKYRVERSTSTSGSEAQRPWVFVSSVTGSTFEDTGLTPSTTYSYRIGAINLLGILTSGMAAVTGGNRRDYSFVSSTITRHISPILAAVATGTTSITWSWTNTVPGVLTYSLYTATDGVIASGLGASPYAEISLSSANARYTRRVRSRTSFGEGDYSQAVVSTLANPPATPVITSSGVHALSLQWLDTDGSTRYKVDRSPDKNSWTSLRTWSDIYISTGFNDTGLSFASTYYYAVSGYNYDGIVSVSSSISAANMTLPLPAAYTAIFATAAVSRSVTAPLAGVGQLTVEIPAGTPDSYFAISTSASVSPIDIPKSSLDAAAAKLTNVSLLSGSITELHLYDVYGYALTANLASPARITINYTDANSDDIVDGTQMQVNTLRLFNLDTSALVWNRQNNSMLNKSAKTVYADAAHFSFYALGSITSAVGILSDVFAYPNPYRPGSAGDFGQSVFGEGIVFESLPARSKVKIFNIAGGLVRELTDDDGDGRCLWDARNSDGARAASGTYLYLVTSPAGGKKSGRIAIIK